MKKIIKKLASLLLAASVMLPAMPAQIQAAEQPYMKSLNVSWDLEPEKEITYQSYWAGLGYRDASAILKNYKITDADKDGYKKLTFTAVFAPNLNDFTAEEVHAMIKSKLNAEYKTLGGWWYCTMIDYSVGKSLEAKNDKDVTVEFSAWKKSGKKKIKDSDGCSVTSYKKVKADITVTYPADYEELCIAVGGGTRKTITNSSVNTKFWEDGNTMKFGETNFAGAKNKKTIHAMLVK